ncbi:hypothetical protein BDW74DRAFT_177901 [Aspergillus multicolor]|uniref:uncharacterized protein n=1 Tax=Aspergillus multicolor TaxID=41759 RepID=UPI003CCD817F
MDPVSVLSIAAAAVAYVDFGIKLTRLASEIHKSSIGGTAENEFTERGAKRFGKAVSDLNRLKSAPGRQLDAEWTALSDSTSDKWWSALTAMRKRGDVEKLQGKVKECRQQLDSVITKDNFLQCDEILQKLTYYVSVSEVKLDKIQKSIDALAAAASSHTLQSSTVTKIQELLSKTTDATAKARQALLNDLFFKDMGQRCTEIGSQHPGSLDWLLRDHGPLADCDDDYNKAIVQERNKWIDWLRMPGKGMFQIYGKWGCGKSAVVKYVSGHSQTKTYLTKWAQAGGNQKSLAIGRAFMIKDGTNPLQRSRTGLVRTLLHSILTDAPELFLLLFPAEWAASARYPNLLSHDEARLEVAFDLLKTSSEVYEGHNIVIFIDGIDEINYPAGSIVINLVRELRKWADGNRSVKICVAFRELTVNQRGLELFPCLKLDKVSRGGLARFVRARLAEEIENLNNNDQIGDEQMREALAHVMINKSDGIFLWTVLSLPIIIEGLSNSDRLESFCEKADALPEGLEDTFRGLLKSIRDVNQGKAYTFISLVLFPREPCPLSHLLFLEQYVKNIRFADSELPQLLPHQVEELLREIRHQITGICGGILEIVEDPHNPDSSCNVQVKFAHGSIAEFLDRKPRELTMMAKKLSKSFDPFRALCETFRGYNKSAANTLAAYVSATIWQFAAGTPSFESDFYRLLRLSKLRPVQFNITKFLGQAVNEICALYPAEATVPKRCLTQWARRPRSSIFERWRC